MTTIKLLQVDQKYSFLEEEQNWNSSRKIRSLQTLLGLLAEKTRVSCSLQLMEMLILSILIYTNDDRSLHQIIRTDACQVHIGNKASTCVIVIQEHFIKYKMIRLKILFPIKTWKPSKKLWKYLLHNTVPYLHCN